MRGRFADKVALVTGASRGIGRAVASRLAREGAEVVLAARDRGRLEALAAALAEQGARARVAVMDVADTASVEAAARELLDAYGRIPLLVNNAGITRDTLLLRMKEEDWRAVIETNLTGLYRVCRAFVPGMVRARYGRIVNISSVVARLGNAGQSNYAAAKAGIEGFTRSLARELASRGITVNCVAPGFIETDMTRDIAAPARERLLAQIPLGRLGTPEDVAGVVAFLLSDEAAYVTGVTVSVDGGMGM